MSVYLGGEIRSACANEIPVESYSCYDGSAQKANSQILVFFAMAAQPVWLEVALLPGFAESMVFFFSNILGWGNSTNQTRNFGYVKWVKNVKTM